MVKYVDYQGVKYPVSISFHALEKLEEEGLSLQDENNYKALKRIFWHSLVAGHFHDNFDPVKGLKTEFQIKEEFASYILDGCFVEFRDLLPLFLELITGQNGKQKQEKQTIKN